MPDDKVLIRTAQIGIKREDTEGTEETLAAADYAGEFSEIDYSEDINEYTREGVHGSLSSRGVLKGQRVAQLSFRQEVAGGSATSKAKWLEALEAMGFEVAQLQKIEISTLANPDQLRTGQTIGDNATLTSATATGLYAHHETGATNYLWYIPLSGTFSALDTVYNYTTSQFSATVVTNPADGSWYAKPRSDKYGRVRMVTFTTQSNLDQLYEGQTIGDNASQGSATKTGIYIRHETSPNRLWYTPVSGDDFVSGDTVYNYTSPQASALTNANAVVSALPFSATVDHREGGYRHTLIGARGAGGLSLRLGEPAILRSEFHGPPVTGTDGAALTGAPIQSVPTLGGPPKVAKGITLDFTESGGTPKTLVLTEMDIDFGTTVADRPTITSAHLAESGHMAAVITEREMRASIDPEASFDQLDLEKLMRGDDTFEINAQLGATSDTHGMLILHAPTAQAEGGGSRGDREGIRTISNNTRLTGTNDDEMYLFQIFS